MRQYFNPIPIRIHSPALNLMRALMRIFGIGLLLLFIGSSIFSTITFMQALRQSKHQHFNQPHSTINQQQKTR